MQVFPAFFRRLADGKTGQGVTRSLPSCPHPGLPTPSPAGRPKTFFSSLPSLGSYTIMTGTEQAGPRWPPSDDADPVDVPEEPFGIPVAYWKAGLILFSFVLMAETLVLLLGGHTPHVIGALYAIPAILFAYFYRRKGVLIVYTLSMYFLGVVILFRYPSVDDIVAAAFRVVLLMAIALTVSYLTHFLLLEKRKYHAIFDNTENGVVVFNTETRIITEVNQRFARAAGFPAGRSSSVKLEDLFDDPYLVPTIVSSLNTTCSSPAVESVLRRGDGTVWDAVIVGRKIAADHAVLTFIDITERKKTDAELRQCHADSNLYLDILTHDINNMNAAALNAGRLLTPRLPEASADLFQKLQRSLEKIDDLIRNISLLRRLNAPPARMVPVSLAGVIRRETANVSGATFDYDGSEATVLADEMISSVFANIIGNAVKFGGDAPHITIRVADRGEMAEVLVTDTGRGIPDSLKPRIFDRFRRGDTTVSGKGLGLFICRSLVERYGGSIGVEDRVPGDISQGTVFRLTLKKA